MNSKRVVVTGGAGRLGRRVIDLLVADGVDVLSVDRVEADLTDCESRCLELTDTPAVLDACAGADSIVHLGAIPGPEQLTETELFQTNVMSTWNIAAAARVHEIKRVVFASSVFTLGWHADPTVLKPQYLPVDEEHPLSPFEAYGLSKVVGEEIMATLSRTTGIPTVSLRIMNVIQVERYNELPWKTPTDTTPVKFVHWPYVDVRDAADSCVQALRAETTGHEALLIAAEDLRFDANTEELASQFFPDVPLRSSLPGRQSVISIEKARRLIGYHPQYTWEHPQVSD